ncbi:MAG: hypothetical protein LBT67_00220, partial [Holosporaceae bacterium]|nr:hypothetical protein [Holosporaceae bacterium]
KIRVIDEKITAAEAKKAEISAQLQHIPDAKESAAIVIDSLIGGLKAVRDGLAYVVQNPMEAAHRAYAVTKSIGGKVVDKTTEIVSFAWNQPQEALDLATAKLSQMYQAAKADMSGTALDLAEYAPLGIGATVEGGRDMYGVYVSGDQELRPVVDKWRNFGLAAAICGKNGKKIAREILEVTNDVEKLERKVHTASNRIGRTGKQARLREIMTDDKVSSAWRGWLKQDANAVKSGKRSTLRVPKGTNLAHRRGFEAAKGYGYEHSNLQWKSNHDAQHRYDNMGRLNKDKGKK